MFFLLLIALVNSEGSDELRICTVSPEHSLPISTKPNMSSDEGSAQKLGIPYTAVHSIMLRLIYMSFGPYQWINYHICFKIHGMFAVIRWYKSITDCQIIVPTLVLLTLSSVKQTAP